MDGLKRLLIAIGRLLRKRGRLGAPEELDQIIQALARRKRISEDLAAEQVFALLHSRYHRIGLYNWQMLTKREKDVALLVARGLSYSQIGRALFLSPETIKAHVYRIARKFGVNSKIELRIRLLALNVLQQNDPGEKSAQE
jgi:DNA-binding NarL/FixJ family response regulator